MVVSEIEIVIQFYNVAISAAELNKFKLKNFICTLHPHRHRWGHSLDDVVTPQPSFSTNKNKGVLFINGLT